MREGIARLLDGRRASTSSPGAGDADDFVAQGAARTGPTSRSSTCRCRPQRDDDGLRAALELRRRAARASACWCSRSSTRSPTRATCIGDDPTGVGYLLKERVGDVDAFVDAVRARRRPAARALDPEVVERMLGRGRRRGPLDELTPRELRRARRRWPKGTSNLGIAEQLVRHRGRGREARRPASSASSSSRSRSRPSTGACSRCSTYLRTAR